MRKESKGINIELNPLQQEVRLGPNLGIGWVVGSTQITHISEVNFLQGQSQNPNSFQ
jgi:hypothetical protein